MTQAQSAVIPGMPISVIRVSATPLLKVVAQGKPVALIRARKREPVAVVLPVKEYLRLAGLDSLRWEERLWT